jgi:ubiquinone/menaquinone biosynthesis C-methylase UbiE
VIITENRIEYVPGMSVAEYCQAMRAAHPAHSALLWFERPRADGWVRALADCVNEFETDADTGRGESYRRAQRDAIVRWTGIARLLALALGDAHPTAPDGWRMLDVLGGDGLIARAVRAKEAAPLPADAILTGDIAGHMVLSALRQGLPAVRQAAQFLLLRSGCLDAVLFAYGTHHIPPDDRLAACQEAHRVLRPGGRVVLHDFEEGSPMADWFNVVVDGHCANGHRYQHFTAAGMREYLERSGFSDIVVEHVEDPLVVHAATRQLAWQRLTDYVLDMYGLVGLRRGASEARARARVWALLRQHLRYSEGGHTEPAVYPEDGRWAAIAPRVALVAHGRK